MLSPDFQEEKHSVKRRAGDSLLLLPTPSPIEDEGLEGVANPPGMTVARDCTREAQDLASHLDNSNHGEQVNDLRWNLTRKQRESGRASMSKELLSDTVNSENTEGETKLFLSLDLPPKGNDRAALIMIPEDDCPCQNDIEETQRQVIHSLLVEKRKLQERIFSNLKDYEKRVTPFRDVFEKMRSLKRENEKLSKENQSMKETLQSTISSLQNQMTLAMATAVERKTELEQKLADAENTIRFLSEKLSNSNISTEE
mmetsp:Transcript_7821/g.14503  ORF Transcript_7821/g.14503 Transcript_7821/m.14503 type:complete len:256 (+) Transcript_7821:2-769(+)